MQRVSTCFAVVVVTIGALALGGSLAAQAAPSACIGAINTSATWTPAGSPYQLCGTGATIAAGVTLTVQSGVTVQFQTGSSPQLIVHGALVALGDPTQPITFTSLSASPGSWWGINADAPVTPAVVTLYYVTLDYGGTNSVANSAQISVDHAALILKRSRLRNGQNKGLYATGNGPVDVEDTAVLNNPGEALRLVQPANGLVLGGLTASGNGLNAVYIQGTTYLHGQRRWPAAGIPYIVNGVLGNFVGDQLTIDAGAELRFTASGYLNLAGDFDAIGVPTAPITLTAQVQSPGAWPGLVVYGGTSPANVTLEYVTLEYGGSAVAGANASVTNGFLIARHSIIRHSAKDGVRVNAAGHATLLSSQIVSNTLYGLHNTNILPAPLRVVEASNNWWGDPAGPTADIAACSPGHGDRVSDGVLFRPVLTSTTSSAAIVPLTDAPIVTLTPRRWFAPADGTTKVYFDIHVADGNGAPLLGRTVRLVTTLGAPTDGGITDANGNTLAYMVSFNPGDADVTATLDVPVCEGALSPTARVTFQPPLNLTDLFPNSPASYFSGNIAVSPEPVLVGISTTLSLSLTNPLTAPITVNVSLGYAQSGLGLTFGPIRDWVGLVIPAQSSLMLSTVWVPPVSGNYCLQATYTITGAGLALPTAGGSSGRQQHNLRALQGPTGSSNKPSMLDKTKEALDVMSGFIGNAFETDPFDLPLRMLNASLAMQLEVANNIFDALGQDPPRQDFRQLTSPHKLQMPPQQPFGNLSAARAAAINALDNDLAEANAAGRASVIALDRSGGASAARDLQWASIQSAAVIEYNRRMGTALISASVDLDNLLNLSASEGITSVIITTTEVISLQQRLAAGWSAQEISDGHAVGLTDAELETIRMNIVYFHCDEGPVEMGAGPTELSGDLVSRLHDLRLQLYVLGSLLINPYAFQPHGAVSGGAGLLAPATASGNTLVQLSSFTSTVQVGNPLSATTPINLSIRRLSLPADWSASVSPAQVTLAPGAVTTVTVTIVAGSPLLQGSLPSVAVEGYAGSQLLGGVVVQALAPNYVFFDGSLHLWLPLVRRQ